MGKKMKLPFLSKSSHATPSWPWPSCGQPKTLSFRSAGDILKTVNAAYIDVAQFHEPTTCGCECRASATSTKVDRRVEENAREATKHQNQLPESDGIWLEGEVEEVVIGLRSDDRLFFDGGETRSILEEAKNSCFPFKESVAMVMDSRDPYVDFRKSMEEMVEAHGMRDWEILEELINWYLRVNEKENHGYVIGAFVDLLVELNFSSNDDFGECSSSNYVQDSLSSPLSFSFSTISTSPCLSSLELVENDVEKEVNSGS